MNYAFFNRNGILTVRINKGRHNQRVVRSCRIDIGGLTVAKHRAPHPTMPMRTVDIYRVDGYTKSASAANQFIASIEAGLINLDDYDSCITLIENAVSPDAVRTSTFTQMWRECLEDLKASEAGLSESAQVDYRHAMRYYSMYVGKEDFDPYKMDLFAIDKEARREKIIQMRTHWRGYAEFMAQGLAMGTVANYFAKAAKAVSWIKEVYGLEIPVGYKPKAPDYSTMKVDWPDETIQAFIDAPNSGYTAAFKLQVYTTFRIGDLFNLGMDNFSMEEVDGETFWVVTGVSEKTHTMVAPVVPEEVALGALANIERYGHVVPTRTPNSKTYIYNLRKFIRTTCDTEVRVVDESGSIGKAMLSDIATAHDLRRVGINLYLRAGMSEDAVKQFFSGHSANSRAFNVHYKMDLRRSAIVKAAAAQRSLGKSRS